MTIRRAPWVFATCSMAVAVLMTLIGAINSSAVVRSQPADWDLAGHDLASIAVVSEDRAENVPGCDAVSVFDLADPAEPVFRGETHVSPGRLAAVNDFSLVLAINSNNGQDFSENSEFERRFLYPIRAAQGATGVRTWSSEPLIRSRYFAVAGGIGISFDQASMYVTEASFGDERAEKGPYSVHRYELPAVGAETTGPRLATKELRGQPAVVLIPSSGAVIHVVTNRAVVHTLDAVSLVEVAVPIQLPRLVVRGREISMPPPHIVHATLSPDDRFVVVNRWEANEVAVADIVNRIAVTRPLAGVEHSAGLAFNHGWLGRGRLVVHGLDYIGVYDWHEGAAPSLTGLVEVPAPWTAARGSVANAGPQAAVAWDGSGARIIAAVDAGAAEFRVIEATDAGDLVPAFDLAACPDALNLPNDIITANGFITPTATPVERATVSASATPTTRSSATSTRPPTQTATATLTPTATAIPDPLYLPLALRETCDPEYKSADVALVLDTSSSMTGQKIAHARQAALLFVGMIDLAPGRSQVAVVRYDREAEVVSRLTRSRALIEAAIRNPQVRSGTHIEKGLRAALGELQSPRHVERNQPVLILLTDGLQTGTPGEELRAAAEVRGAGVRLYTIGLGDDVDETALKAMAGDESRYYFAPDSGDLARIYGEIAQGLMCPGKELWGGR